MNRSSVSTGGEREIQKRFFDERYSQIGRALNRLSEPHLSYDRRLVEAIAEEIEDRGDSRILEICAGQGVEAILLSERAGLIICTDISRGALKVAKELARSRGKDNIELIQCDAEHLPFRDEVFDLSFGKDALHHVANPAEALREMRRCSRDLSKIIAIEANPLNPQMALIGFIDYSIDKGVFRNGEGNLVGIFRASRLRDIRVRYREFFPRSILFYVSSPLPKIFQRYPFLYRFFDTISGIERKLENTRYIQKFSNFLIITGTK